MGYVTCVSHCAGCGLLISYNPNRVPSIRVNGVREPLCVGCVERANAKARAEGQPEFVIQEGAYEPADEHEINWDGE